MCFFVAFTGYGNICFYLLNNFMQNEKSEMHNFMV